jgi:hypothetical protein
MERAAVNSVSYYGIQHLIGNGDLIEVRSRGVVGAAIRRVTGEEVNHSVLVIVFVLQGTDYVRRYVIEADECGLHLTYLSSIVEKNSGRIYWSPVLPAWQEHRQSLALHALLLEGTAYDWKGLFKNIPGHVRLEASRLFCSEAIQAGATSAYMVMKDFNGGRALRPGELHKMGFWDKPSIVRI